jgi:hypothetical protein
MGERSLKWGLRLLGVALFLGPIFISLGANNWDPKAAVLPSEAELNEVADAVKGVLGGGFSPDTLTLGSPSIVGDQVSLPAEFRSPFNIPVKIRSFSIHFRADGRLLTLNMKESAVEVPARGIASFTLVGTYGGPITVEPTLSGFSVKFEALGVQIEFKQEV